MSSPVFKEFSFPAHTSSTCRKCTSDLHRPMPINRMTSAITGTRPEAAGASPASILSIRDHDRDGGFCVRRPRLTAPGQLASRFERPNLLDPNDTPGVSRGSSFFLRPASHMREESRRPQGYAGSAERFRSLERFLGMARNAWGAGPCGRGRARVSRGFAPPSPEQVNLKRKPLRRVKFPGCPASQSPRPCPSS